MVRRTSIPSFEELSTFERSLGEEGFCAIAGVDEAGRGALAGPVVAGAVILPSDRLYEGVYDSKHLSSLQRDEAYELITGTALAWAAGIIEPAEIDSVNILQATLRASKQALNALERPPDFILFDALELPELMIPQKSLIKGDTRSVSIAAASIIAKVTRDRLMVEMESAFPGYGFAVHKGYGTKVHLDAIKTLGASPIHRLSFAPLKNEKDPDLFSQG
jgi:ribonuclease HII